MRNEADEKVRLWRAWALDRRQRTHDLGEIVERHAVADEVARDRAIELGAGGVRVISYFLELKA